MRRTFLGALGLSVAVAAILCAPQSANADWTDDFESYANGQLMDNVGGWSGWDNSPGAAGSISIAQAHSGLNSILATSVNSDAVHPFIGEFTSGQVSLSSWMFLEDAGGADTTHFIVNNQYNHGGPYVWTTQLDFNMATDVVTASVGGAGTANIIYDAWAEINVLYDLDANTQQIFYNGALMSSGVVDGNAVPIFEIANIDLYNPSTASVYYDDFSVTSVAVPEPGTLAGLFAGMLGTTLVRRRR